MTPGSGALDPRQLERAAEEMGFQVESFEKVLRLTDLLNGLRAHPYLATRLVLKGGTALNLFLLGLPRLSVDIDLNYVGAADLDTMRAERPEVERAIDAVCRRCGLRVRRVPEAHAGGKWRLAYDRAHGGTAALELDLNFLLRVPLWSVVAMDTAAVLKFAAEGVPVLDVHELAGGKLAALFSRAASRDLYDTVQILQQPGLDRRKLRLAFVVYGAMTRRDWREVSVEEIELSPGEATSRLLPLLRAGMTPAPGGVEDWCRELVDRCRSLLAAVLPFEAEETRFLDLLLEHGEIRPELLTSEPDLQERIRRHPALLWKAFHVRRHRGKMSRPEDDAGSSPLKEP